MWRFWAFPPASRSPWISSKYFWKYFLYISHMTISHLTCYFLWLSFISSLLNTCCHLFGCMKHLSWVVWYLKQKEPQTKTPQRIGLWFQLLPKVVQLWVSHFFFSSKFFFTIFFPTLTLRIYYGSYLGSKNNSTYLTFPTGLWMEWEYIKIAFKL